MRTIFGITLPLSNPTWVRDIPPAFAWGQPELEGFGCDGRAGFGVHRCKHRHLRARSRNRRGAAQRKRRPWIQPRAGQWAEKRKKNFINAKRSIFTVSAIEDRIIGFQCHLKTLRDSRHMPGATFSCRIVLVRANRGSLHRFCSVCS